LHLTGERIRSAREGCVVALVLFAAFGVLDIWAATSALVEVWTLRAFVVLLLLGLLWSTWFPFFLKRYVPLVLTIYMGMGLATVAMIYVSGMNDLARHHYYIVIILEVMALYTWSFLSLYLTAATGFFLVGMYVFMAVVFHHMNNAQEWPILLSNCFFLVGANIIGIYSNIKRNRYLYESFLHEQNLLSELERTEDEKKLSDFNSDHDVLTGLPNRKQLMRKLNLALNNARANGSKIALLFIDLDGFKPINDELGHATGDIVLTVIGKRLANCVRASDLLARIGGDEFIVVLETESNHHEEVHRVASSILSSFERPIRKPDIEQSLSASIGIAFFPDHASEAEQLIVAADLQMYVAKRQGRGIINIAA
jgi:diguanylate cyclase (GGDEF)-like protein